MGQRRLLIIGSQCNGLNPLSFLENGGIARELHTLMTEPGPGECIGAPVGDPPGLLLDPTVIQAKAALQTSYSAAAVAGDTLIFAYVGHAEVIHDDFFLMPTDASVPPRMDTAILLTQFIKDLSDQPPDGLLILLDTCHSGVVVYEAGERWVRSLRGQLRFELLTATDVRSTARAWFTKALIQLLTEGDPAAPKRIRCQDARRWLGRLYPQLAPQLGAHNADDGLHLGRNVALMPGPVFWSASLSCDQILEQTKYYQPSPQLGELVYASRTHQIVIATGTAGVGKSTLAAALARPEITEGFVPPEFSHAVVLLSSGFAHFLGIVRVYVDA
jgi:Caspase domain